MRYIDLTLPTPYHNIAFDEALLDWCEQGEDAEILRFWESREYFTVLGYSGKIEQEINLPACRLYTIPILRRASGGGTVLQGPGCLNYTLILRITSRGPLTSIGRTNEYIMKSHQAFLAPILNGPSEIKGTSDLVLGGQKFSGNAQRRKKNFLLFHGTFLTNFDLTMIAKVLSLPKKQPPYRNHRTHLEFLTNLNIPSHEIKERLRAGWNAVEPFTGFPFERVNRLVAERYATDEWNYKF